MKTLVLAMVLVGVTAAPAFGAPEDVANQVASEVMSPYCDGVTLHDCPSKAALDLRAEIEMWARDGWTKAEIMDELERQFGPRIRATPGETEGVAAWALPTLALVAGGAAVALLAIRWTRRRSSEDLQPIDGRDHARVERELAALREEMR